MDITNYIDNETDWEIHVQNENEFHECIAAFRLHGKFRLDIFDDYRESEDLEPKNYLYPLLSQWSDSLYDLGPVVTIEWSDIKSTQLAYELWT